jgi:hypothetical protein
MLVEMGGDVVVEDDGRWSWRFSELELELRALSGARARSDEREREVGQVEFSSMGPDDDPPRRLAARSSHLR